MLKRLVLPVVNYREAKQEQNNGGCLLMASKT